MYISKKVLVILVVVIALLISSDYLIDYLKNNSSETDTTPTEENNTQTKVDPNKEKFVKLFQEENYEKLLNETNGQETQLIRDMHLIARSFIKFRDNPVSSNAILPEEERLQNYKNIVDDLSSLKEVPSEIEDKVAQLLDVSGMKYQWAYNKINHPAGNGNPEIGMTRREVLETTWGNPEEINTTKTASSIREQWVYRGFNYVYFENGVVTSIQN